MPLRVIADWVVGALEANAVAVDIHYSPAGLASVVPFVRGGEVYSVDVSRRFFPVQPYTFPGERPNQPAPANRRISFSFIHTSLVGGR
jgi:hypothetical protein